MDFSQDTDFKTMSVSAHKSDHTIRLNLSPNIGASLTVFHDDRMKTPHIQFDNEELRELADAAIWLYEAQSGQVYIPPDMLKHKKIPAPAQLPGARAGAPSEATYVFSMTYDAVLKASVFCATPDSLKDVAQVAHDATRAFLRAMNDTTNETNTTKG